MTDKVRIIRGDFWAARLKEALSGSSLGSAEWMEENTQVIKSDADSMSGMLSIDGTVCFLKFYPFKSFLHRWAIRLGIGRPLRNYAVARDLDAKGLAVPRPLACLVVPQGMLLLIEGLSGGGSMAEMWLRSPERDQSMRMLRAAGETLATLHQAGYAHRDCEWNNLFWDGQRVCLVDLDNAHKCRVGGEDQAVDLARFTVNAELLSIGSTLFEQFLSAYLQKTQASRRHTLDRILPVLLRLRKTYLPRHGKQAQRLV